MNGQKKCSKCQKDFQYNQSQDQTNNELIPIKLRKVVIDPNDQAFPFYSMPKDKQRLVDEKFIHFMCSDCLKIS